ncbi:MAG: phosphonopyruvate decarboxylase [Clostridia bacterium]|nr:phosphonopyruvate decarboxylase [Clostridia bacterium]
MINPLDFYNTLLDNEFTFFTGVPDSLLKELCMCITDKSPSKNHIIAANEGNALALACGYNISTSDYGLVYMQNSGLGNIINPLLSLADENVYKIPMLLVIGYRGEPGVKDEPQHIKQGELTLPLLDTLNIKYIVLNDEYKNQINYCHNYIKKNEKPIAVIVKKDTFSKYENQIKNNSINDLTREKSLEIIINNISDNDFVVSTTGKTSREIFEIREKKDKNHANDFLTVGSMGHTASLAAGISLFSNKNIFCIDGDGSFLMHLGGLAVAMQNVKNNFKYILINNGCHESVGGQPTISDKIDLYSILKAFGFEEVLIACTEEELKSNIKLLKNNSKIAMIINTNNISRQDLGRPTTTPAFNKKEFQEKLRNKNESINI